jgi:hypothetical protein|tara:strand:- start:487 stop:789 length:303 start_codon:yes stop_codon:yes gene_type:complete
MAKKKPKGTGINYLGKEVLTAPQVMTSPIVGDITFTFNQNSTKAEWVIVHNLNRFPSVTVVDSADTVVQGTVVYNSNKQLTVTFFSNGASTGFQGKAYLN